MFITVCVFKASDVAALKRSPLPAYRLCVTWRGGLRAAASSSSPPSIIPIPPVRPPPRRPLLPHFQLSGFYGCLSLHLKAIYLSCFYFCLLVFWWKFCIVLLLCVFISMDYFFVNLLLCLYFKTYHKTDQYFKSLYFMLISFSYFYFTYYVFYIFMFHSGSLIFFSDLFIHISLYS